MRWRVLPVHDFGPIAARWDELNQRSMRSPVLSSRYIEPLLQCFASGRELIAVGEDSDGPTAMGVFAHRRPFRWESFYPPQAALGLWLAKPGFHYERELPSLPCALGKRAILLRISGQDPELTATAGLRDKAEVERRFETARVTIQGSFEDYWQRRGKNFRHTLKRQRNLLEREGIVPRLIVVSDQGEVRRAVAAYGGLESGGWKGRAGTAVHAGNRQGAFWAEALDRLALTGKARVYQYYFNDKLVATDLCIHDFGTLVVLKTTYDESLRGVSPSQLMKQDYFRQIFDRHEFARIEFYGELLDWHTKWTDETREIFNLAFYPYALGKQAVAMKRSLRHHLIRLKLRPAVDT